MRITALALLALVACHATTGDDAPPDPTPDADVSSSDGYVQNCDSLFSARIVEKHAELDPTFHLDCEQPLRADVGSLGLTAGVMCNKGETANACRQRMYETPPAPRTLRSCTGANCLRGMWLPRCADGTDTCEEPQAICPDGTRPLALVEAANPPSNRWLIYTTGEGGPCDGTACWAMYRFARTIGDQSHEQTMSSSHPDYQPIGGRVGAGIMNGTATSPLAAFNRVEIKRCTEAASDGKEMVPVGDGVSTEWATKYPMVPVETRRSMVPVWHRGFPIHSALLHALASPTLRDLDGNGTLDIPSLAQATQIAFAGSSDASSYYVMAVDELAEIARTIAPSVDVRLIADGKFDPSLDSEGRYAPDASPSFSVYTSPYHTTRTCGPLPDNQDEIANETCSDRMWMPGPGADGRKTWFDSFTARGSHVDTSCNVRHAGGAPCFNDFHVIANHVQTPVLVLADQEDAVVSDKTAMADVGSYHWPQIADYRTRVLAQAHDLAANWSMREETAPETNLVFVLRKQRRNSQPVSMASHTHLAHDERVLEWSMTKCQLNQPVIRHTTAQTIVSWLDDTLTDRFVVEDGRSSLTAPFWVTGTACRIPE
ncbi:MAG: hypothetical protein ACKV2T_02590 [Kofleriaceae bacterium]